MTLQPYDGANRVHLPNGRTCWEKETRHHGFSETFYSYQYSIEIVGLPLDYNGRVIGLKLLASDGSWNEVVAFLPVSLNLIDKIRALMEQGWAVSANYEAAAGAQRKVLGSSDYLSICEDVLAVLKSGVKK